jgi:hypothetical protein
VNPLPQLPFEVQEQHWKSHDGEDHDRTCSDQHAGWNGIRVYSFWYTFQGDRYSIVEVRQCGGVADVFNFQWHVSARDVFDWMTEKDQ